MSRLWLLFAPAVGKFVFATAAVQMSGLAVSGWLRRTREQYIIRSNPSSTDVETRRTTASAEGVGVMLGTG